MDTSKFVVLTPVKPFTRGKSRLRAITTEQRRALAEAFARDTLTAVLDCAVVEEVVVVTTEQSLSPDDGAGPVVPGVTDLPIPAPADAGRGGALQSLGAGIGEGFGKTMLGAQALPAVKFIFGEFHAFVSLPLFDDVAIAVFVGAALPAWLPYILPPSWPAHQTRRVTCFLSFGIAFLTVVLVLLRIFGLGPALPFEALLCGAGLESGTAHHATTSPISSSTHCRASRSSTPCSMAHDRT